MDPLKLVTNNEYITFIKTANGFEISIRDETTQEESTFTGNESQAIKICNWIAIAYDILF
jgi:hypothetical protein